jgi:hypothetical protein
VLGINNAIGVSVGKYHSCALLSGGAIKCWGYNDYGGLGDGNEVDSSRPVLVKRLDGAGAVEAGWGESCAVVLHGIVKCWGNIDEEHNPSLTPIPIKGLADAQAISLGGDADDWGSCAIVTGGTIKCWGWQAPPSTVELRALESRR